MLFNTSLEKAVQKYHEINVLDYADDLVVVGDTKEMAVSAFQNLKSAAKKTRLFISERKTEYTCNKEDRK